MICTVAAWQGLQSDSISAGNTRLLMIFVGVVSLSMLVQAIVVVAAAIGASKTQKRVLTILEELRTKAVPIMSKTEALIEETLPRIQTISKNLVETSEIVRSKARELEATITDVNAKTKAQVIRVDEMVSSGLTATGALADMIHKGIRVPIVEMSGIVNGVKAGIDVLFKRSKVVGRPLAPTKYE